MESELSRKFNILCVTRYNPTAFHLPISGKAEVKLVRENKEGILICRTVVQFDFKRNGQPIEMELKSISRGLGGSVAALIVTYCCGHWWQSDKKISVWKLYTDVPVDGDTAAQVREYADDAIKHGERIGEWCFEDLRPSP
jgi:hypothetical protein